MNPKNIPNSTNNSKKLPRKLPNYLRSFGCPVAGSSAGPCWRNLTENPELRNPTGNIWGTPIPNHLGDLRLSKTLSEVPSVLVRTCLGDHIRTQSGPIWTPTGIGNPLRNLIRNPIGTFTLSRTLFGTLSATQSGTLSGTVGNLWELCWEPCWEPYSEPCSGPCGQPCGEPCFRK